MPTYEYRCKNCSHQFDIIQSFADDALTVCPSCSEATLKKVFGNVGITFKGSGFYKTDSRSAGSFGSTRDSDKSDNGSSTTKKSDSSTSSSSSSSSDGGSSSSSADGSSSSSSSSNGSSTSSSATASKPA